MEQATCTLKSMIKYTFSYFTIQKSCKKSNYISFVYFLRKIELYIYMSKSFVFFLSYLYFVNRLLVFIIKRL